MKKNIFRNGFVFGFIFLLLGTGIFPTISGRIENKYKTDLSEFSLKLALNTSQLVIGLMNVINKTTDYLEAINIFGFWITKGQYGGFFEPNEIIYIYGFKGLAISIIMTHIVIGTYDYIIRYS